MQPYGRRVIPGGVGLLAKDCPACFSGYVRYLFVNLDRIEHEYTMHSVHVEITICDVRRKSQCDPCAQIPHCQRGTAYEVTISLWIYNIESATFEFQLQNEFMVFLSFEHGLYMKIWIYPILPCFTTSRLRSFARAMKYQISIKPISSRSKSLLISNIHSSLCSEAEIPADKSNPRSV